MPNIADDPGLIPGDPVTARVCPIDPTSGKFCSDRVEAAYQRLLNVGGQATRGQFRRAMIMHNALEDRADLEYKKFREQREKEVSQRATSPDAE